MYLEQHADIEVDHSIRCDYVTTQIICKVVDLSAWTAIYLIKKEWFFVKYENYVYHEQLRVKTSHCFGNNI